MRVISPKEYEKIKWLKEQVTNFCGNKDVDTNLPLEKYGYDSLDGIELIMNCEQQFQISIPDCKVENCKTLEDLYKAINEILNEK